MSDCEICENTGFNERYIDVTICRLCPEGKRQRLIYLRRRLIEIREQTASINNEIDELEKELTP